MTYNLEWTEKLDMINIIEINPNTFPNWVEWPVNTFPNLVASISKIDRTANTFPNRVEWKVDLIMTGKYITLQKSEHIIYFLSFCNERPIYVLIGWEIEGDWLVSQYIS
jgi:hypothetical protein